MKLFKFLVCCLLLAGSVQRAAAQAVGTPYIIGRTTSPTTPAPPVPPASTTFGCGGLGYGPVSKNGTFTIGGNSVTITSTMLISDTPSAPGGCGLPSSSGGPCDANRVAISPSDQVITLNFSRPVTNIQIYALYLAQATITFTTDTGTPTATTFGGTCQSEFTSAGGVVTANQSNARNNTYINVGGRYFSALTITIHSINNLAETRIRYCYDNASSL